MSVCMNPYCDKGFADHAHGSPCGNSCTTCKGLPRPGQAGFHEPKPVYLKRAKRRPPYSIRKLPLLKSAPWTIISPRRLQMVGCPGYTYGDGQWAYPFKSQRVAMTALENALKRETK